MSVQKRRAEAVAETIALVRAKVEDGALTPEILASIKAPMIALAASDALFPAEHCPPGDEMFGGMYRLSEDADRRFALYASAEKSGFIAPPHDHTTWAVIAGVRGAEHNVFYARTDDGAEPGVGTLEKTGEFAVLPGTAAALMPDDFHTIEITGPEAGLHLHLYGHSLEDVPERIVFAGTTGGPWRVFPPDAGIGAPVIPWAELESALGGDDPPLVIDPAPPEGFVAGRISGAISLPLGGLATGIGPIAGSRDRHVVLCGADRTAIKRAALALTHMGFGALSQLSGGTGEFD
ncbi:MAG: hypothetical protein QGG17_05325 [Rhodospirillales bacterium]|nr:hypothetical protein [Rhodospirillales bacterium]